MLYSDASIGLEMVGSAQIRENEDCLQPTPVEQGLVTAMIEQKENWPAIYQEMAKVSKEDLLSDSEFCDRHKRPSLTAFFVECGEIGGVKISLLRKYQRAGAYYESARTRYPELPPITDEKVRKTPPDLFALVAKINHLIRKSGSASIELRGQIEYYYLSSLLEGTIARKDLKQVYSLLDDGDGQGTAEQAICNLIEAAPLKNPAVSAPRLKRMYDSELEGRVCELLSDAKWLNCMNDLKMAEGGFSVYLPESSLSSDGFRASLNGGMIPDLVVMENATGQLRAHAFDVKTSKGLENARSIHRLNTWARSALDEKSAFEFIWVVVEECTLTENDLEEIGLDASIGVLCLDGNAFRMVREPQRLSVDVKAQLSFYKAATSFLASQL